MIDAASPTVAFECSHNIVINAPAKAVFDYVTNPQSWPEWLAASHHIDSENRPLETGETFHEKWHIRSGEVSLDWIVRSCISPKIWIVQAETTFIGPIVVSTPARKRTVAPPSPARCAIRRARNCRRTSRSPTWMPKPLSGSRISRPMWRNAFAEQRLPCKASAKTFTASPAASPARTRGYRCSGSSSAAQQSRYRILWSAQKACSRRARRQLN